MKAYPITKQQYDYLLPVPSVKAKMHARIDKDGDTYYLIGTEEDYQDLLDRCVLLD